MRYRHMSTGDDSIRSSHLLLFAASIDAANHICGELAAVTFNCLHLSFQLMIMIHH
jgi:hypothetical protein